MISIEEVDNGYIVTRHNYNKEERTVDPEIFVVEDTDYDNEALKKVLLQVAELLGCTYDRWGSENINITFDQKGHKAE
jgi:hypothetical protein